MTKQWSNIFQWQHNVILILPAIALAVYVGSESLPSDLGSEASEKSKPTFVLVHGAGMGAWCWYKVLAELKREGFDAVAIDLATAGINPADPNTVTTIDQLSEPLFEFVANHIGQKNLILVGHSLGGISISRVMELYTQKVLLAIYVAAVMPLDGDNFYNTLTPETQNEKNEKITLIFGNPGSTTPTSGFVKQQYIQKVFLNRSPEDSEVIELIKLLYKPVAYGPTLDTIHLTPENYGSIERHYIKLLDDFGYYPRDQQFNIDRNSEALGLNVYTIDSDHTVQLSDPQNLTNLLVAIFTEKDKQE